MRVRLGRRARSRRRGRKPWAQADARADSSHLLRLRVDLVGRLEIGLSVGPLPHVHACRPATEERLERAWVLLKDMRAELDRLGILLQLERTLRAVEAAAEHHDAREYASGEAAAAEHAR